ncbi:hypothetical protein ACIRPU_12485 [Streptomyces sp. NPDC102259]|uniref:hypothetical protein n=1 Tax=Streptomyces sp. NPDC102259 TaxID=3366148 RepID=UPI0037FB8180
MSIRDRAREALYNAMNTSDGTPASARRATQLAAVAANAAADQGHTGAATAIAVAGAAAVAAEGALSNYVYPPGNYATFRGEATQ